MTTGNEPAQPDPKDQPSATPAATDPPAPAADPKPAEATPATSDVDELELSEALKAVEAEKTADGAAGDGKPAAGEQPTTGKPGEQQQQPPRKDQQQQQRQQPPATPMIPKPRLDEALARADKGEREAAHWRGVAQARGEMLQGGGQPQPGQHQQQPAPPKPEERLAAIHAEVDALAKQFDDGKITYSDLKSAERKLADEEQTIREGQLLAKVPTPKANNSNELYLETLTAELEEKHPWTKVFDQVGTDADWGYLKDRAIESLTAKGIDPTKGDVGRYELRREIAELADQLGPTLIAARATAKGITLPASQPASQGQQQQQRGKGQATPAQRAAKLALQQDAPPNLSQTRGTGEDPAQPTESRIETMSDEEIAALPVSVKNKLLGVSQAG